MTSEEMIPRTQPALTEYWIKQFEDERRRLIDQPNPDLPPRLQRAALEAVESQLESLRDDLVAFSATEPQAPTP